LVRAGIDRIERDAVITDDGARHPADIIVYATGFQANKILWPMRIVGRDGEILSERWDERPTAYLGITIPGYPNFFCMYGPGTNLAHGGSLIFHSECQMRYITECLELLIAGGHKSLEPTEDKAADWHAAAKLRCAKWCGHNPRSNIRSTRTALARCTS
jgi:4-hydroxyacetophenone monooxygenase